MVRSTSLIGRWECEGPEFTQILSLDGTGVCTMRYVAATDAVRQLLTRGDDLDHGTWRVDDDKLYLRFAMTRSVATRLAGLYPPAEAVLVLSDIFDLRGEDVYDIHKLTALKLNLIREDGVKLELRR
jgi:hypothetical protein